MIVKMVKCRFYVPVYCTLLLDIVNNFVYQVTKGHTNTVGETLSLIWKPDTESSMQVLFMNGVFMSKSALV